MRKKLFNDQRHSGNIGIGVLATFLSLLIMGPILGAGWIISGLFGGLIARGKLRGLVAGLIGGLILSIAIIEVSYYILPSTITTITSYTGNFYLVHQIVNVYYQERASIRGSDPLHSIIAIIVEGTAIPAIGGLIGGAIIPDEAELD